MNPERKPRIWFNKAFSSVFHVLGLLRAPHSPLKAELICSHTEKDFLGFEGADECYLEPGIVKEASYIEWCLNFCKDRQIDIFIPGKHMASVSSQQGRFAQIGTRILTAAKPEVIRLLDDKAAFYEKSHLAGFRVPAFIKVNNLPDFEHARRKLAQEGLPVCLKPNRSTGGNGFRILDDTKTGWEHCATGDSTRISPAVCRSLLPSDQPFRPLLLMEYLPGPEYSIDCLAHQGRLLRAVIRKKPQRPGGCQWLETSSPLFEMARELTTQYHLTFLFNIQLRQARDTTPALLEINPRMSGGIHMAALSGLNLPAWGILLALNSCREQDIPLPKEGVSVHQPRTALRSTKVASEAP
jgi:biotin carboxylase